MKNLIVITSVVTITSSSIHEKYINSVRSEVSKFHCSNFTFAVAFPIEAQATFAQYVSSHQWRILPPHCVNPCLIFLQKFHCFNALSRAKQRSLPLRNDPTSPKRPRNDLLRESLLKNSSANSPAFSMNIPRGRAPEEQPSERKILKSISEFFTSHCQAYQRLACLGQRGARPSYVCRYSYSRQLHRLPTKRDPFPPPPSPSPFADANDIVDFSHLFSISSR